MNLSGDIRQLDLDTGHIQMSTRMSTIQTSKPHSLVELAMGYPSTRPRYRTYQHPTRMSQIQASKPHARVENARGYP